MAVRSIKTFVTANVSGFVAGMERASRSADKLRKSTDGIGKNATMSIDKQRRVFDIAGKSMVAFGAASAAGLGLSAKAAIDWESAFTGVRKTVDDTEAGYARLSDGLRAMARELPASHKEIAAVAEAAGQLGINRENIESFTRTMIDLGVATNLSSEEAATGLARFANVMGTSQDKFSNIGSAVVDLGNNFATTESEIVSMGQRLAAAGKVAGLTEGDVLGLATALTSVGINAESGGTAFSKVMLRMKDAIDEGADKLDTFARVSGVSAEEFARAYRGSPAKAIEMFVKGLGRMNDAGESVTGSLEELQLSDIRVRNSLLSSAAASDLFSDALERGNRAFDENVALSREAHRRYETTASQLEILKNNVYDLGVSVGSTLLPAINAILAPITSVAGWFATMSESASFLVSSLGMVASFAGLAGGAFLLLAPRVVKAVEAFKILKSTAAWEALHPIIPVAKAAAVAVKRFTGAVLAEGLSGGMSVLSNGIKGLGSSFGSFISNLGLLGKAGVAGGAVLGITAVTKSIFGMKNELIDTDQILERFDSWAEQDVFSKMFAGFDQGALDNYKDFKSLFDEMANTSWTNTLTPDWLDATGFDDMRNQILNLDDALKGLSTGQAVSEFKKLWSAAGRGEETFKNMYNSMPEAKKKLDALADSMGYSTDASGAYMAMLRQLDGGMRKLPDGTEASAKALEEMGLSAEGAEVKIDELVDAMEKLANVNMSADEAAIKYNETLEKVTQSLHTGAGASANGTEAQRENMKSLIELSKAGWDVVKTQVAQSGATDELAARQRNLAVDFVNTAQQMGMNRAEAVQLANQYGLIPKDVKTAADFDKAVAEGNVLSFKQMLESIPKNTYSQHTHTITEIHRQVLQNGGWVPAPGGGRNGMQMSMYADGGWTGPGSKYKPAGIVHADEYVLTKAEVRQLGGPHGVESWKKLAGLRGYSDGGLVSVAGQVRPQSYSAMPNVSMGGNVYIQAVNNPVAEPTTVTASKELQRLAAFNGGLV